LRRRREPGDFNSDERTQNILPGCIRRKTKIVTNQGWINPEGAGRIELDFG
jgi:hypothetical protein